MCVCPTNSHNTTTTVFHLPIGVTQLHGQMWKVTDLRSVVRYLPADWRQKLPPRRVPAVLSPAWQHKHNQGPRSPAEACGGQEGRQRVLDVHTAQCGGVLRARHGRDNARDDYRATCVRVCLTHAADKTLADMKGMRVRRWPDFL